MIQRMWHGWTTLANADAYERLLREQVFPGITARGLAGLHGLAAWRRRVGEEVEFVTVMSFADLRTAAEFTGGDPARSDPAASDPARSVVPQAARRLLTRYDARSRHYDLVVTAPGGAGRPGPVGTVDG